MIEGKEIPKTLATSSRGIPRSRASNTFSLRSSEYALMRTLSLRIKEYATRCETVARYPTEHENSIPHTRLHHTREILDAIFYLLSRVAALGDYCRTT